LPVYISLKVLALIEGRGIDFNTFDVLNINVGYIVGPSTLSIR